MVIYNAAALTFTPMDNPFSLFGEEYLSTFHVNVIGAYVCLCESVAGFKQLMDPGDLPKAFIATGNVVPFRPRPAAVTLGPGKAALVHLVQVGNQAYEKLGCRFYFASQITKDGSPVPYKDVDAAAHGRQYTELVDRQSLGDWDVRFIA